MASEEVILYIIAHYIYMPCTIQHNFEAPLRRQTDRQKLNPMMKHRAESKDGGKSAFRKEWAIELPVRDLRFLKTRSKGM